MAKFHQFNVVNDQGDVQNDVLIRLSEVVSAEPHFLSSGSWVYTTINLSNRTAFKVNESLEDLEDMLSLI